MFPTKSNSINARQILILIAIFIAVAGATYFVAEANAKNGILFAGGIIAIGVGIYSFLNFRFAFYLGLCLGFVVFILGRFMGETSPSAVLVDLMIHVSFFALLFEKFVKKEDLIKVLNHPISFIYLVYIFFLVLQMFNPNMHSIAGWVLVFRKFLEFLMLYFIALHLFSDLRQIKLFYFFWLVLATIAGFYGVWQEWVGFTDFEQRWIYSQYDQNLFGLGGPRKFSLLAGPAEFGNTMAASAIMVFSILLYSKSKWRTLLLIFASTFMLLGMAFSGTRTSYVVIIAGGMLIISMTITHIRTLIFALFFVAGLAFVLWAPIYGNTTINRIRTAFEFSDDASLSVRDINRKRIQPYIWSHPIGGGVATSGLQGEIYNPNHVLAGFPPDSGLLRTSIETGWIGLALQLLIYFIILQSGISSFYRCSNPKLRPYLLAAVGTTFTFIVAQYSQVAIGQMPESFLFYGLVAAIVRLKQLDKVYIENLRKEARVNDANIAVSKS